MVTILPNSSSALSDDSEPENHPLTSQKNQGAQVNWRLRALAIVDWKEGGNEAM